MRDAKIKTIVVKEIVLIFLRLYANIDDITYPKAAIITAIFGKINK